MVDQEWQVIAGSVSRGTGQREKGKEDLDPSTNSETLCRKKKKFSGRGVEKRRQTLIDFKGSLIESVVCPDCTSDREPEWLCSSGAVAIQQHFDQIHLSFSLSARGAI